MLLTLGNINGPTRKDRPVPNCGATWAERKFRKIFCVVCVVIFTGVISSVYSVNALALQKNIGLSHGEAV